MVFVRPVNNNNNNNNTVAQHHASDAAMSADHDAAAVEQHDPAAMTKQPAPALGAWTDVWESRQASDIIHEDLGFNKEDDNAATPADPAETAPPSEAGDAHPRRIQCHNPYSLTEVVTDVFICQCDDCSAALYYSTSSFGNSRAVSFEHHNSAGMYETVTVFEPEMDADESHAAGAGNDNNSNLESEAAYFRAEQNACLAMLQREATADYAAAVDTEQLSVFMPPPPPRLDTCEILFANGSADAEATVFNMQVRWYRKLLTVQKYFVPRGQECPAPCPESYGFMDWCEKCAYWWCEHFEHRQKKHVSGGFYQGHGMRVQNAPPRSPQRSSGNRGDYRW